MVRSIPQLESLRDAWDDLAARVESPLVEHDWFLSCAEALHREEDLRIVTTRAGGVLSGAAPLAREDGRLVILGSAALYEPADWLFASEDALSDLVDQATAAGRPMILRRMRADSEVAGALSRLPRRRALVAARPSADSLAVNTRGAWDTYHAGLSSRITSNLQRLRRKAEKALGPVTFLRHVPAPGEIDRYLEVFTAVEASGWKGRRGSSLASRADLRDFFRRYCRRAAARGRLRISTLSFGTRVGAVELSIEAYRRAWQLKIGYEESLAGYYPGLQLTEASIRSAFELGLEAYEFLGVAEEWERHWRPEARRYRGLAVYPVTVGGLTHACRDAAGAVWRKVQRPGAWLHGTS